MDKICVNFYTDKMVFSDYWIQRVLSRLKSDTGGDDHDSGGIESFDLAVELIDRRNLFLIMYIVTTSNV